MTKREITIKPRARHNGLSIVLASFIALCLVTPFASAYWQDAKFALMFLILFILCGMLLGLLKYFEPQKSVVITPEHLTFIHRKGRWQLPWQRIRNINSVNNTYGVEKDELAYIGLVLESLEDLVDVISLRLANNLIHEQQPLVRYCLSRQLITMEQAVMNFEPFVCPSGKVVKGPLAGFLHQAEVLKSALGSHLFIGENSLDRSTEEFIVLLKECKQASINND